jgi:hypothetical protein
LDGEAVLLNVETGVYYGLNPLGTDIWRLISTGSTEQEICSALLGEYEVEPGRLRIDVASFLNVLREKGLTRLVAG